MSEIKDSLGIIQEINSKSREEVILDIGCGANKKIATHIGLDMLDLEGVDIVGEVLEVTKRIQDNSIDKIYTSHFLEHIEEFEEYLNEFSRILKLDGVLEIIVPHYSNPYFYSDPTHKRYFGLYTMCYFTESTLFKRTVPKYNHQINFALISVRLNFSSTRPFYIRHAIKKIFGFMFGASYFMQEFWEENLSFIFPCYDIKYNLKKISL
ncbi:class I SAM-dependent methyltransferase [Gammaproteobacteria bacterium]|jgi:ubiquinone/menaquinone biosynthesis C-methylase UbiE|nr:class I SAM-dependent methyltransferase [Gammaproteobacteria bacterium]